MRSLFFTSLLALITCLPHLRAYKIDASCKNQDRTLVKDGVSEAFDMADAAKLAIQNRANDPDVSRLLTLVFGQNPDLERISTIYENITLMKDEKDPRVDISNDRREVVSLSCQSSILLLTGSWVLYCNIDRVQKRQRWWDTGMLPWSERVP